MAKKKQTKVVNTSGKRKTAIARATVKAGKGRVRVNSEPIEILQPELARNKAMEPLVIADAMNRLERVDINVNTIGGGQMGQQKMMYAYDPFNGQGAMTGGGAKLVVWRRVVKR